MNVGELVAGSLLLLLSAGCSVAAAVLIVRRRLPEVTGAPGVLACGVLAVLGFVAVHLLPGALGILGRGSVAACAVLLAGAALAVPSRPAAVVEPQFPSAPASGRLSWALALVGAAAAAVYALAQGAQHGGIATRDVDMTTFHLPGVARWIQTESLWGIHNFVPHWSFGTYPNTSDVVTLGAVLPFDNDFLVPFVNYPALALAAVAVYVLGRELGAPAAPAALFASTFTAMRVVADPAFAGLADTLMLATFGAGVAFLLRSRRTGARSDLVLAGLALGLCFGTKWYAVPAVVLAAAAWAGAGLLESRPTREVVRGVAALVGLVTLSGGFWLLRNLVQTGNPVFPVEIGLGGVTIFAAPEDLNRSLYGSSLADYLDDPGVWRRLLWPSFLYEMGWAAVVLWGALPVAVVVAWLRRDEASGRTAPAVPVAMCVVIAAAVGAVYLFIPYTAYGPEGAPFLAYVNARYVVPALMVAAALGAWATGRLPRAGLALQGLALLALFDALRRTPPVSAWATPPARPVWHCLPVPAGSRGDGGHAAGRGARAASRWPAPFRWCWPWGCSTLSSCASTTDATRRPMRRRAGSRPMRPPGGGLAYSAKATSSFPCSGRGCATTSRTSDRRSRRCYAATGAGRPSRRP